MWDAFWNIVIGLFGGGGILFIIILLNADKVEIWVSIFWKIARCCYKGAEKKYIQHDIQGHVNSFNKMLSKEIKNYDPVGVRIKWIGQEETEKSFFQSDNLIIRMRKSENQNKNFVLAAMTFISQVVLKKAKRYIGITQKQSVDLFVGKKLFQKQKPEVLAHFIENYFVPQSENSKKVSEYLDKYSIIDKVGLFFPVLVQELNFLGNKVFGEKKESIIIKEVNGLIDLLKNYSEREIGETSIKKTFNGRYCHFGVMIIARSCNVISGNTSLYIKYIEKLLSTGIENIYIVGPAKDENMSFIENVCNIAVGQCEIRRFFEKKYNAMVKIHGKRQKVESFLVLLRKKDIQYQYDSEDQMKES